MIFNSSKTIIPDTNVYLRFILNDIVKEAAVAEQLFKKAKEGKLIVYTPQIVMFEIEFILNKYYRLAKTEIAEKLESIISNDYLNIQDGSVFIKAIETYKVKNVSFVDCFLLAFDEEKGFKLFSFDKKLRTRL